MRIGVSSPSFALEPFLETLETVTKDFTHWEIVADLNQLLPDIAEEFKQNIPSYDIHISVHAPFNDLNIAALNPKLRELAVDYIKNTISTADDLGIDLISIHPGHLNPSGVYAIDKIYEANKASIKEIDTFARGYNVRLALENMPIKHWTLGTSADEILEMIADTEIGICFDIGHAYIVDEGEAFLNHIDKFYNVHLHDNNGRRDEHLIIGEGKIDLTTIVNRIIKIYSGNFIIESNNIEEAIRSKENLQKILKS